MQTPIARLQASHSRLTISFAVAGSVEQHPVCYTHSTHPEAGSGGSVYENSISGSATAPVGVPLIDHVWSQPRSPATKRIPQSAWHILNLES